MQSHTQSNLSFYQNQAKKENKRIKLRISFATRRIFKNFISQEIKKNHQVQRLITFKRFYILLAERKKITFDKYLQNKTRLENRISKHNNTISIKPITKVIPTTEINTLNELIPVTPTTATKTILNDINTLTNQINRLTKLNSYATFLNRNLEKITFYKYRQILLSIRNKIDLKQRILNLLLWEKERLIKVA
jgi:hypothetical protein